LNASDLVVLAFVPVRGAILLLHAFRAGVVPGVLAGLVDGFLLCAFVRRYGVASPPGRRWVAAALGGALAAAAAVLGVLAFGAAFGTGAAGIAPATLAFEIGSGVVCGVVAAPRAMRLAAARTAAACAPAA
jgi:hypothetical protein